MTEKNTQTLVKEIWDHYNNIKPQDNIHWPNHTKEELERVMHSEMSSYEAEDYFHIMRMDRIGNFLIDKLENNRLSIDDMAELVGDHTDCILEDMIETLIERKDYKSSEIAVDLQRMIDADNKKYENLKDNKPSVLRQLLKKEVA